MSPTSIKRKKPSLDGLSQQRSRAPAVLLVVVTVLAPISLLLNVSEGWPWPTDNDFAHYYVTARVAMESGPVYTVPLTPLYDQYGFAPSQEIAHATNPPALVGLTMAVSWLPPLPAWLLWTALQLAALVGAVVLGLRVFGLQAGVGGTGLLLFAVLAMFPSINHLRYGQVQNLILFLIVLGAWLLAQDRPSLAAFLWGMATSLKLFTFPLLIVLWRYRDIKAVAWFMAGFAALHLAVMPWMGLQGFTDFGTITLGRIGDAAAVFPANVGAYGTLANTYSILYGRVLPGGSLWALAGLLALVAILVADLRHKPTEGGLPYSTAICLTASTYLSLTCWPHYFVLLVLPLLAVTASITKHRESSPRWPALLLAYSLIAVTTGRLPGQATWIQLVTAWWGTAAVILLLILLLRVAALQRSADVRAT